MTAPRRGGLPLVLGWLLAAGAGGGCVHGHKHKEFPVVPDVPSERQKILLPEYVIGPPDLLQIDLLYAIPLPPYRIQPLDVLAVNVANTPEGEAIAGLYPVGPDGMIVLGGRYGSFKVAGMTPDEARAALQAYLGKILANPVVTIVLAEGRGMQLVRGQHLVRPDGSVSLGSYGSVVVAGRTLREAKKLIEDHLRQYLQSPEVVVNVIGYNSKVYYLVFDFGGAGQQVIRLPVTGNDTVLDAVGQVNGLTSVSDPRRVWVARSAAAGEPDQILPVDWPGLVCRGRSETNYQLMPGDRIFVQAYPMVAADVALARLFSPFERVFGFTLLGTATYQQVRAATKGVLTSGGTTVP